MRKLPCSLNKAGSLAIPDLVSWRQVTEAALPYLNRVSLGL